MSCGISSNCSTNCATTTTTHLVNFSASTTTAQQQPLHNNHCTSFEFFGLNNHCTTTTTAQQQPLHNNHNSHNNHCTSFEFFRPQLSYLGRSSYESLKGLRARFFCKLLLTFFVNEKKVRICYCCPVNLKELNLLETVG